MNEENKDMGNLRELYWQIEGIDSEQYCEFLYPLTCVLPSIKREPEVVLANLKAFIKQIIKDAEEADKCPSCGGNVVETYEDGYRTKYCEECGYEIERERTHESLSSVENSAYLSAKGGI